jgi:hypothetical protein
MGKREEEEQSSINSIVGFLNAGLGIERINDDLDFLINDRTVYRFQKFIEC